MKLPGGREVDEQLYRERFEWKLPSDKYMRENMQPCRFCLRPAFKCIPYGQTETKPTECDGCWEVSTRLEGFLREGGQDAATFVHAALRETSACYYCGSIASTLTGFPCQCENDE